jgi:uncharacterized membrane protein YfcA
MDDWTRLLLVGVVVFLTHALEGITGFGCTVLAMPFVAMLLGLKVAKPLLVVLAWLLAGYIVTVSWKKIVWKEFLFILLYVGIGLPVGMAVFSYFSENILTVILALVMLTVGFQGFVKTWKSSKGGSTIQPSEPSRPVPKNLFMRGTLFLGGIVHGMFGTGGPFVVIYASKALPDKSLFRVSLCLLWATLNTVLIGNDLYSGNVWTPETCKILLLMLPFLAAGTLLGDFLHHHVSEYYFRLIVYGVLFASGLVLFYNVSQKLFFLPSP